jgi:hypothetical protein
MTAVMQTADIGNSLAFERTHVSPWLVVRMHKRVGISYALFLSAESLTEDVILETTERLRKRVSLAQPFPERSKVKGSRDSSVGIATGYGLDGRISFPEGAINCSLLHRVQARSVVHPAS